MNDEEAARFKRPADLVGEFRRPGRLFQTPVAGKDEIERVPVEGLPASLSEDDQRQRWFLENSDGINDADFFQRQDVLAGGSVDAESSRIGKERTLGDQILEYGGVEFDGSAPFLSGQGTTVAGDDGGRGVNAHFGTGEVEILREETEIAGVAGSAFDGDDISEACEEDKNAKGKQTNKNVSQEALFHNGGLHDSSLKQWQKKDGREWKAWKIKKSLRAK